MVLTVIMVMVAMIMMMNFITRMKMYLIDDDDDDDDDNDEDEDDDKDNGDDDYDDCYTFISMISSISSSWSAERNCFITRHLLPELFLSLVMMIKIID